MSLCSMISRESRYGFTTLNLYVYVIGILTARYRKISSREPEYESLRRVSVANEPKDSYSGERDDILKYLSVQNSDN